MTLATKHGLWACVWGGIAAVNIYSAIEPSGGFPECPDWLSAFGAGVAVIFAIGNLVASFQTDWKK